MRAVTKVAALFDIINIKIEEKGFNIYDNRNLKYYFPLWASSDEEAVRRTEGENMQIFE